MNKKRLVITSLVVSGALLIGTIGTTLAWFAGSPYLEYNNISISLADKNIEISTDDIEWFPSLDNDNLETVDRFRPVTSMYSNGWISRKATSPEFRRGYDNANKQFMNLEADCGYATQGFFSQELYIKSDADTYLTIDTEKTYFAANKEKNKALLDELAPHYPDLSKDEIYENLNSIEKSLRMSILILNDKGDEELPDYKYYIIEPNKDRDTLFVGIMDNDDDGYYDSIGGYESVYGDFQNTDKIVYDETSDTDSELTKRASVFDAKTRAGVRHFNLDKSIENGLNVAKENSIALEEADKKVFIPLSANISKKFVVSFYMEGWDLDNTNVTMYANFIINVSFMIATNRAE